MQAIANGFGENAGKVLASLLHGKGNILVNHAFPGGACDKRHYDGLLSVIKKYPDMHVVAETWGRASDELSQTEAARCWPPIPTSTECSRNQANSGSSGLSPPRAGSKIPIVVGEGGNGFRLALADRNLRKRGLNGVSSGGTPAEAAFGFKVMMEILTKQRTMTFRHIAYPLPWAMADDIKICTGDRFENGCNAFPRDKVPDTFFVTVMGQPDDPSLLPEMSLTAALQGKPTPGMTIQRSPRNLSSNPTRPA